MPLFLFSSLTLSICLTNSLLGRVVEIAPGVRESVLFLGTCDVRVGVEKSCPRSFPMMMLLEANELRVGLNTLGLMGFSMVVMELASGVLLFQSVLELRISSKLTEVPV